ncbi:unnamed protein product [Pleuronectes platessa]|uniref:Uncharacterized protein n=1 Tax=Pleuronectes platessa TaxID=8262 RepID=A0A9N7UDJ7_PLEPL|nr:unnamed protein product [Pleuronectes platessa]
MVQGALAASLAGLGFRARGAALGLPAWQWDVEGVWSRRSFRLAGCGTVSGRDMYGVLLPHRGREAQLYVLSESLSGRRILAFRFAVLGGSFTPIAGVMAPSQPLSFLLVASAETFF